jgi:nucleoside-diphosphate-sugar epimerase
MADKKQNVLITGARGFIGHNLVEYLNANFKEKYSLFSPFHKDLELLKTEMVDNYIESNKIDVVIHAANVGGNRKTGYDAGSTSALNTNLRMFMNLSRSIPRLKKFIFMGSGAEYDRASYVPKMKEEYAGIHIPADDYGLSKLLCSKLCENSVKMVDLRIFGMYGKYEDFEFKFISNSIIKNLMGLPIVINQNVHFDYMYINDGIKIIEKLINMEPKHRAYNLTTGNTIDLLTIAKTIIKLTGIASEIIVNNPGLNVEYSGDNSRLMKELKYSFTPAEKAISELIEYYKGILPSIDRKTIETDEFLKYCKTKK